MSRLTRFKEQANKNPLPDDITDGAKRKKWDEYQQSDEAGRDELTEGAAADIGDGLNNGPVMKESDDDFLKGVQNEQENKIGK